MEKKKWNLDFVKYPYDWVGRWLGPHFHMVGNLTFAWGLTQVNSQVSSSWILEPQSTQSQW
jgi:hypothetical protein